MSYPLPSDELQRLAVLTIPGPLDAGKRSAASRASCRSCGASEFRRRSARLARCGPQAPAFSAATAGPSSALCASRPESPDRCRGGSVAYRPARQTGSRSAEGRDDRSAERVFTAKPVNAPVRPRRRPPPVQRHVREPVAGGEVATLRSQSPAVPGPRLGDGEQVTTLPPVVGGTTRDLGDVGPRLLRQR